MDAVLPYSPDDPGSFCAVGMWKGREYLAKRRRQVLLRCLCGACLFIFLFQTNFIYEVAGTESWSIPLSGYRMDPTQLYGSFGFLEAYSGMVRLGFPSTCPMI
jgi:hypothetical protein